MGVRTEVVLECSVLEGAGGGRGGRDGEWLEGVYCVDEGA